MTLRLTRSVSSVIFTHSVPKKGQKHHWSEAVATVSEGFSAERERQNHLELLKPNFLKLEDGARHLLKLFRLRLGKDLQQDVFEHNKRFFHRSARGFQLSMQHYVAEESNLYARASQAVRSVSNTGESETAAKKIRADALRRFLLLENAARPGPEQFFWRRWQKLSVHSHYKRAKRDLRPR